MNKILYTQKKNQTYITFFGYLILAKNCEEMNIKSIMLIEQWKEQSTKQTIKSSEKIGVKTLIDSMSGHCISPNNHFANYQWARYSKIDNNASIPA